MSTTEAGGGTPDINAFLDAQEAAEDTGNEPEPTPVEPTTPAPAAETDPFDTGAESFPRDYVEKLRKENATYRTRAKDVESQVERYVKAFEGLDDDVRDTFLNLPSRLRNDPAGTAAWLKAEADAILAEHEAATPPANDADRPLTKAELDRYMAERDQRSATEAQVREINDKVTALGYDPSSVEGRLVMLIALEQTDGDIDAAHAKMAERDKAAVDKFLDGKKTAAANGTQPVPQTGATTDEGKPIKNVRDAGDAFDAHLETLGYKY